jgi:hypothetical protein
VKKECGKKYLFRFDEEVHDHKFKRLIHRKSGRFAEISGDVALRTVETK